MTPGTATVSWRRTAQHAKSLPLRVLACATFELDALPAAYRYVHVRRFPRAFLVLPDCPGRGLGGIVLLPSEVRMDESPAEHEPRFEILLIEDDDEYRAVVRDILEEEGYRVVTAVNGRDAMTHLQGTRRPDLILTDLWMPAMDGWAVVAAVRERPHLAGVPVVVTSGSGDRAPPPCAAYLAKPVGMARLLETIAACLARRAA